MSEFETCRRDAYTTPRDDIMQTMARIYRYRMTTTSGGNLSIRDENGDVWISPARVDKGNLTRNDIVCVKADGSVEGPHPPSSEFPFHQAVYKARPDIRAIVHAHPVALVAFSICGQTPDTTLFHQAHSVCGRIGFAPYALPGSEQLGRNIADTFTSCDSVILENHGVVVGGQSLSDAFQRFEAFEFAAKTIIKGKRLGEIRYLTQSQLDQARDRCRRPVAQQNSGLFVQLGRVEIIGERQSVLLVDSHKHGIPRDGFRGIMLAEVDVSASNSDNRLPRNVILPCGCFCFRSCHWWGLPLWPVLGFCSTDPVSNGAAHHVGGNALLRSGL
mgnify:CR=1 FL=1